MERTLKVSGTISSAQAEYDTLRFVSDESACPYLAGREARHEAYLVEGLEPAAYERLLARGFRRSGRVVYRPRCRTCHECRQLRVPVEEFRPTASMRRVVRRNADVCVEAGRPEPSEEKFTLYRRYLDAQHDGTMSRSRESFLDFLYDSPTDSCEFRYRLGERVVGISIADRVPRGLSSVYMYFDPDCAARSLGTFSIVREIEFCRRAGLRFYYLGYFVADSRTMAYKARFSPNEILIGDDRWLTFRDRGEA